MRKGGARQQRCGNRLNCLAGVGSQAQPERLRRDGKVEAKEVPLTLPNRLEGVPEERVYLKIKGVRQVPDATRKHF